VSLFDPPNDKKLAEVFPVGTAFMLYEAEYEGMPDTTFGPRAQATVLAGPADRSGTPERYKVWGTLAEQVQGMETGDLPALVKIGKQGNRNIWVAEVAGQQDIPF